jgi:hypothetical protein
MSAQLTIISWRDIPAQVTAKAGRQAVRRELSPRFQVAIDRAAMNAGLFGTDEYLSEWRREACDCGDDLEAEVTATVERLETTYTPDVLAQLVDNGGTTHPTENP